MAEGSAAVGSALPKSQCKRFRLDLMDLQRSVGSSPTLRNKKDLIMDFVDRVSASGEIDEESSGYVARRRAAELNKIVDDEELRPEETGEFIDAASRDRAIRTTGTGVTRVLPPTRRFGAARAHGEKKHRVLTKLGSFEQYFGLRYRKGEER